jgi:CRISPR-associated protein Cmr2
MSSNIFHFSISPVQSFVAEARRTRDLWAGSYILSYLSGIALWTVENAGGEIRFPSVDYDVMFLALDDPFKVAGADYKEVGSLPNRFKAKVDNPKDVAQLAACEVQRAWEKIGLAVWNNLSEKKVTLTDNIKEIWVRQVENQWEISWAIGDDSYPIEKRKNIRIHLPEDEPGEKCTICGERQALSPNGEKDSRSKVSDWWEKSAKKFNGEKGFHFRDDGSERLCAVCTIKRIFPLVTKDAIVPKHGAGWDVPTKNYPSTPFMSAMPWLISILQKARDKAQEGDASLKNALQKFVDTAKKKDVDYDEMATVITTMDDLVKYPVLASISGIRHFRGDVFFEDRVNNDKEFKLNKNDRHELLKSLDALYKVAGPPYPYYALLVMDGDNMGALLLKYKDESGKINQQSISTALSDFNKRIKAIVDDSNGKLIYGGGDDVLALLPVETALDCAQKLRNAYITSFRTHMPELKRDEGTISAGIIYSHMTTPLQAVVRDAHSLLDKKAKEETGKDAFAIRVWKRGGPILEFAKKWEKIVSNVDEILDVKKMFSERKVSSGFIFRFRELIDIMEVIGGRDQRLKLLVAEYLKSRESLGLPDDRDKRLRQAKERMEKIYDLSLSEKNKPDSAPFLFIKFLTQAEKNP